MKKQMIPKVVWYFQSNLCRYSPYEEYLSQIIKIEKRKHKELIKKLKKKKKKIYLERRKAAAKWNEARNKYIEEEK